MPRGPKGERRPADVIGNAVKVMRIATGEEEDTFLRRTLTQLLSENTGMRRSDAVLLGPDHVKNGWIKFTP